MEDCRIISPFISEDDRGFFLKTYEMGKMKSYNIEFTPYETFFSLSQAHTIRGLHFQTNPMQAKLVSVLRGRVFDVVLDLRRGSKTFGKWKSFELSQENHYVLYIPKGFAHGFYAYENDTLMSYICDERYNSETDTGIKWDDKTICIDWPCIDRDRLILSERDKSFQTFESFRSTVGALEEG